MTDLLYGRHSVLETLRAARRRLYRLWIEGGEQDNLTGPVAEIHAIAAARNLPIRFLKGGLFDKLDRERVNHQGVALEAGDYPTVAVEECLRRAREQGELPLLLLLDHLQDPQNLGTLIRTAEAAGVHGIILPDRRTARVTPAVSNASAGAVEHMLVAEVTNLNRTLDNLKTQDCWVAGLDSGPDAQDVATANLGGGLALVVGSEGEGLSRLTRERCDFLVRIPMRGRVESLNAAVAGSIVLYLARQARRT